MTACSIGTHVAACVVSVCQVCDHITVAITWLAAGMLLTRSDMRGAVHFSGTGARIMLGMGTKCGLKGRIRCMSRTACLRLCSQIVF